MNNPFFSFLFSRIFRKPKLQTVASRRGKLGEDAATSYLRKKGFKIVERNWRYKRDEIDIICQKDAVLIFVEVKTRKSDEPFDAFYSVTKRKKTALKRAVHAYLQKESTFNACYRFDIVAVALSQDIVNNIYHYENCTLKD